MWLVYWRLILLWQAGSPGEHPPLRYRPDAEGSASPRVSPTMAVGTVAGARRDASRLPGQRPVVRGTVWGTGAAARRARRASEPDDPRGARRKCQPSSIVSFAQARAR